MTAYYNEINPYAAQWLRNLIDAGHIAAGVVDERSITDVEPEDLVGFTQHHFFAGIGGWSYALRLAGWPDDRPCWTGSCPCQPFSSAGARRGFDDPRHLWPQWKRLIAQCRPPIIFGEQSARAADWLRLVHGDLEAMDYAVGAMPIEAACVGAQQLRDRYWFVARADDTAQPAVAVDAEVAAASAFDAGADGARLEVEQSWHARQLATALRTHSWPHQSDVGCVAYGVPGRVEQVRAFGNAIVPQVAAAFICAATS
jgi:DNA (cytosine-5)-methyltransferase 1